MTVFFKSEIYLKKSKDKLSFKFSTYSLVNSKAFMQE